MSTVRGTPVLVRRRDCYVAGVAGGLADHLGWPVVAVRVGFAVATLFAGAGALFYGWLWALTPWADRERRDDAADGAPADAVDGARVAAVADADADADADAGRSARTPDRVVRRAPVAILLTAGAVGATVLAIVLAAVSGGDPEAPFPWAALAALAIVLAVAAGAWASFVDRPDPERGRRVEFGVRIALTVSLVVLAVALAAGPAADAQPLTAVACAFGALVGVALVYAPELVRLWRDLSDERVRRIRDEQRSEMAAHLHDSVLQTLALIQNRAGASSEAGRLARAQERELRSWLHGGDAPADSDLATDLRDFAAALELDYPVRIEVIAVGMSAERASGELAAAAREAMVNAARHSGGDVSVYLEGSERAVDVYVRDRGPGFDPAEVPSDRLGVRQSIIGRMRRAGGSATVTRGADGTGTEVHLRYETEAARG